MDAMAPPCGQADGSQQQESRTFFTKLTGQLHSAILPSTGEGAVVVSGSHKQHHYANITNRQWCACE